MRFSRAAANVLGFLTLMIVLARPARTADDAKITYAVFTSPVEIPGGKLLQAGEYAFELVDASGSTKVVQIFLALQAGSVGEPSAYNNNKPMTLSATLLAVPDYRNRPSRTILTYWRGTNALRTLTFIGAPQALVFVYPRARAAELAKGANQPAPSMESDPGTNINNMKNITAKATSPNGQDVDIADVFGKPGDRPADRPATGPQWGCNYEAGDVACF